MSVLAALGSLPDSETTEAIEGYFLLRIDQNGWIEVTTDEVQIWVEATRRGSAGWRG